MSAPLRTTATAPGHGAAQWTRRLVVDDQSRNGVRLRAANIPYLLTTALTILRNSWSSTSPFFFSEALFTRKRIAFT